ncbi:hypothetical protein Droror1_Dr00022763 [Drosera rotundifolia]
MIRGIYGEGVEGIQSPQIGEALALSGGILLAAALEGDNQFTKVIIEGDNQFVEAMLQRGHPDLSTNISNDGITARSLGQSPSIDRCRCSYATARNPSLLSVFGGRSY